MSDVINLRPGGPESSVKSTETLQSKFGDDDWLLEACAEWRVARAQQQINWTKHDAATGWGNLVDEGIELSVEPLHHMKELEFRLLREAKPRTMLLARELLNICVTILAYRQEDPKSNLAEGPLLEIIRNVVDALDFCKPEMKIGPRPGITD